MLAEMTAPTSIRGGHSTNEGRHNMNDKNTYPYVVKLYKHGEVVERYHYQSIIDIWKDVQGLKSEYTYKVIDMNAHKDITELVKNAKYTIMV